MTTEQKVKQMYTEYTYPKYNSYMDKFAPIPHQYSNYIFLEQLNHYIYNGKQTFNNYNILVAGVGLGGDLINMAYFLKDNKNTKIVGIDLSPSSLKICKERVKKYNLEKNVTLIEMSLLDLDSKIHGMFDLIISIGVLHHLENPTNGLKSLKSVLKQDGCMAIMVYGKIGRTGIYQMQDLLKIVNNNVHNYSEKIENFKNIYKNLPKNWFKRGEELINDHTGSDEGIVDLLLHCQDRAYNIKELFEWFDECSMNFVDFSPHIRFKLNYNIPNINSPTNIIDKYSLNELYFGDIIKYSFWLSNKNPKNIKCSLDNLNNIMTLVCITKTNLDNILKTRTIDSQFIKVNNLPLTYNYKGLWTWDSTHTISFTFELSDIIYVILNNIDNKKTTKTIFQNVRDELKLCITDDKLLEIWKPVYELFNLYDLILLKSSEI